MALVHNIKTGDFIRAIANKLKESPALVSDDDATPGLLAKSTAVNAPDGPESRRNSIVPMTKVADERTSRPTPLIGIRSGQMVKVGYNSYDVFIFIRCYTSLDKAFVENDEILSLVNSLLDQAYLPIPSAAVAEMTLEQVSGEEYDEGFKLNYRESQFRLNIT